MCGSSKSVDNGIIFGISVFFLFLLLLNTAYAGSSMFSDSTGDELTDSAKEEELVELIASKSTAIDTGLEDVSGVELDWIENGLNSKCLGINVDLEIKDSTPLSILFADADFNTERIENVKFYQYSAFTSDYEYSINSENGSRVEEKNGSTTTFFSTTIKGTSTHYAWVETDESLACYTADSAKISELTISEDGYYKACFNLPIKDNTGVIGTQGSVYVQIANTTYVDKQHSSWWNSSFDYKRNITVYAPSSEVLPQFSTAQVCGINVQELAGAGKMLYSGNDTALLYNGQQIDFMWLSNTWMNLSNTLNTTNECIVFRIYQNITEGGSDSAYEFYYGNPAQTNAIAGYNDGMDVYMAYDDFNRVDGSVNNNWSEPRYPDGGMNITNNILVANGSYNTLCHNISTNDFYMNRTKIMYSKLDANGETDMALAYENSSAHRVASDLWGVGYNCFANGAFTLHANSASYSPFKASASVVSGTQSNIITTWNHPNPTVNLNGSNVEWSVTNNSFSFDPKFQALCLYLKAVGDKADNITLISDYSTTASSLGDETEQISNALVIDYPTNTTYSYLTRPTSINYTYVLGTGDKCWYNKGTGTVNSTSVTAGANFTSVVSAIGSNTINVYCNDTAGVEVGNTTSYYVSSPELVMVYPSNTTYVYSLKPSVINYTFDVGSSGDKCWYNNGGANSTGVSALNNNITGLSSVNGSNTLRLYCNLTDGTEFANITNYYVLKNPAIVYPLNTTYGFSSKPTSINYTWGDATGSKCWYSLNSGANSTTANAGVNFTGITSVVGSNKIIVTCNNTGGYEVSDTEWYSVNSNNVPLLNQNVTITNNGDGTISFRTNVTDADADAIVATFELDIEGTIANFTFVSIGSNLYEYNITYNWNNLYSVKYQYANDSYNFTQSTETATFIYENPVSSPSGSAGGSVSTKPLAVTGEDYELMEIQNKTFTEWFMFSDSKPFIRTITLDYFGSQCVGNDIACEMVSDSQIRINTNLEVSNKLIDRQSATFNVIEGSTLHTYTIEFLKINLGVYIPIESQMTESDSYAIFVHVNDSGQVDGIKVWWIISLIILGIIGWRIMVSHYKGKLRYKRELRTIGGE